MAQAGRSSGIHFAPQARAWNLLVARPAVFGSAVVALGLVLIAATLGQVALDARLLLVGLAGLIALGILLATLYRPEAAVPVLLYLLFTRLSDYIGPQDLPVSFNQLVVGLFLVSALLHRLLLRRAGLSWDRLLGWMLVYGAAIALSSLGAYNRVTTLAALVAYLREAIIVFVIVNLVTTVAGLRLASWALIVAGAFLAGVGVLHAATGYDFGGLSSIGTQIERTGSTIRLDGPVGVDSNYFGQLLVTVVPLALYRAWDERRLLLRAGATGALVLVSGVIVWTFSRGSLLALLAALGIAAAMQKFSIRILPALGLAVALVGVAAPSLYWDRLSSTIQYLAPRMTAVKPSRTSLSASPDQDATGVVTGRPTSGPSVPDAAPSPPAVQPDARAAPSPQQPDLPPGDASINERLKLLRVGALIFLDHPFSGVGKGNYYAAYPDDYWRVDPALPVRPKASHSTPVQIAAETGLVGLATFGMLVLVAVIGLRNAKRRCAEVGLRREARLLEAVEVAIYGYLVTSMFLHDNTYQRYLWLLIGLAAAGRQVALRSAAGALPPAPAPTGSMGPA